MEYFGVYEPLWKSPVELLVQPATMQTHQNLMDCVSMGKFTMTEF